MELPHFPPVKRFCVLIFDPIVIQKMPLQGNLLAKSDFSELIFSLLFAELLLLFSEFFL